MPPPAFPVRKNPTDPAPLHATGSNLIPNAFIVMLLKGHTLEKHFKAVGTDLSPGFRHKFGSSRDAPIGYVCDLNPEMLQKVRMDPGVEFVEQEQIFSVE